MAQDFTQGGNAHIPYDAGRAIGIINRIVDFSKTPATAAEVLAVLKVPANCLVSKVVVQVLRAEGSAGNIDTGDGSDPDGYLVDTSINALAAVATVLTPVEGAPNTFLGYTNGKFYTAADTIDIIPSIDLDFAIVSISALVFDFGVDLPVPA